LRPKPAGRILLWHAAAVLLALLEREREGGPPPTLTELIRETGISESVFHLRLKRTLEEAGLVEYAREDRKVTARLTEKGRRLAACLASCKDLILDTTATP